jgi:hypothetical protein
MLIHRSACRISGMGQNRKWRPAVSMSASPPTADITHRQSDFRKVPLGDINSFAKNNLLGPKLRRSFLSQVSNSLIRLRATLAALRRIEKVIGPGEA